MHRAPTTFATKGDAGRYLDAVRTRMAEGLWLDPEKSGQTLETYARAWVAQRSPRGRPLAVRTGETYRNSLDRHISPRIGHLALSKVTPSVVREWHSELVATGKPTAARQAYALLRAVLNTAVDDGSLHRNPCRIAGAGQPKRTTFDLLDRADVAALTDALPPHLQTLVTVTFWAHLRLGEVVALRRGDVDLAARTLHVARQVVETDNGPVETPPKAASIRTIHLPEPAVVALTKYLAIAAGSSLPGARLFTRPDGRPLRGHHIHKAWGPARKAAGLPSARFHDLRHAGLTLAAQYGATTAEVMARGGHSSSRAALLYQHAASTRDAELAARMSEAAARDRSGTPVARGVVADLDAARQRAEGETSTPLQHNGLDATVAAVGFEPT